MTLDHGLDSPASPQHQTSPPGSKIQPAAPSVDSISEAPLYVNTDASSKQIGNYSGARIIANSRGYVRYMRAAGREVNTIMTKNQAASSGCCDDIMCVRKQHYLENIVYPQYTKCPFASICKKCAVYEEHFMNMCHVCHLTPM